MTSATLPTPAAADFMTSTVHTVSPDTEITEAVGVLTSRSISGAPVVDAAGHVLGVLTQEGCMRALSGAAFNDEEAGGVVDHMTREFAVAEPTADLFYIVSMLSNDAGRRVLIVHEHKLLGIITRTDVLKALHTLRKARKESGDGTSIETVASQWSALTD